MEEEEFNEKIENEEEEKDDKLEVIIEENINSENYFSTNKKNQDKNKTTSSKYQNTNKKINSNQNELIKEKLDKNKNELRTNFQNNIDFNNNDYPEKEEAFEDEVIEGDINNIIDDKEEFNIKDKIIDKLQKDKNDRELVNYNINQNNNLIDEYKKNIENDKDFSIENIDNNYENNEDIKNYSYSKENEEAEKDERNNIKSNKSDILNNNERNRIENENNNNEINIKNKEEDKFQEENQIMELYSYEGNENSNKDNNNENINEEYYINKNIIDFENKKNKNKEIYEIDNNDNLENNKDKFLFNSPYKEEEFEEKNVNNERKRSGVIKLNNFNINKNIDLNNNEEEITNEHKNKLSINLNEKEDKDREKMLSTQKGAMKILQLLISKKQEKEEKKKQKEENKFENLNKSSKDKNIETKPFYNETDRNKKKNIKDFYEENEEENEKDDNIKKENDENDAQNKKLQNNNVIHSERTGINKNKIYIKNSKNIPYRKLKINKKNNTFNQKNGINENKNKIIIEKIAEINKYKKIQRDNNLYNYYNFNTNPTPRDKNEKYYNNQYKNSLTPFNDYLEMVQQSSFRNNTKINNKEEHSMILYSKPFNSIDNSFDSSLVYKKRNTKDLTEKISPSLPTIYSYIKPNNSKRNSYSKNNSNYDNYDNINEVIKTNNNNVNIYKSQLLKKNNIFDENKNYNNYTINSNKIYSKFNNKTNNKKKFLYSSKTSNNFINNKRDFINYQEIDNSSDNINYNQNTFNKKYNNIYMNYIKNKYDDNYEILAYKNINNYNSIDCPPFQNQNFINNNQSLPSINSKKYSFRNKFLQNNNYYDSEKEEENNYIGADNDNYKYKDYIIGKNYLDNNRNITKKNNNSISINLENLMIFEEKLNEIIYFLKNRKEVINQCNNFWNYFYTSFLYQRIEQTFKEKKDIEIIKISINYELLSIMLCYEFSFDKKVLNKTYILLLEILELNHRNLMIICENILNKITAENQKNKWVLKLNEKVQNSNKEKEKYHINKSYSDKINYNTDKISKKIKNVLLNYKTEYSSLILSLMKKITQKNYEEINDFFREYILRINYSNKFSNISDSKKNQELESSRPPYILSPREKPYTLVLGLNEILANFQQINYNQGVLKLRPYLIEFLENISRYYELILFTSGTQYYAEPIIRAIEHKKKYFDFIFYRDSCIFLKNNLVKDLTRIGRPLDSIIIIEKNPQYFKLQKENGIKIKPFLPKDSNDRVLYDLIPILINIAQEEIDVREGLSKYRFEIMRKITSIT